MTKEMYNALVKRSNNKKNELEQRKKSFLTMCQSQIDTETFERNAINDLLVMQQLKAEISELEYQESLMVLNLERSERKSDLKGQTK